MHALVLADIDDLHWRHGTHHADLILALGDVADAVILEAAEACGLSFIFAVKSNHDRPTASTSGMTDLDLHVTEYGGMRFGGFSGC